MATREVIACDFCKHEVECDSIPLAGSGRFDVCKPCFGTRGLEPLMAAAREAREAADTARQTNWHQYAGLYGQAR